MAEKAVASKDPLKDVLASINKKFGKNVAILGDDFDPEFERIPTKSLVLNHITGGGVPRELITEIFGEPGSGKSGIAYGILGECQAMGEVGAVVDAEHSFDAKLARIQGIDLDKLVFVQPDSGEQAIDVAEALIRSGQISCLVFDSVAAMQPLSVMESSMDQQFVGRQAAMLSRGIPKLVTALRNSRCACIFINQIRTKPGAYAPHGMTPTAPTGGFALPFYASVRIEVRRGRELKDGELVTGYEQRFKTVKNRTWRPKLSGSCDIYYGIGVDNIGELATLAVETGLVKKAGSWLSIVDPQTGEVLTREAVTDPESGEVIYPGGPVKFQGFDSFAGALREDTWLYHYLKTALDQQMTATREALVMA